MANAVPAGQDKERIASLAKRKFSASLASDTKWNALIVYMRSREGGRPSYRSKWVNGYISGWDTEWFYHLPFPFVGVEWFDIELPAGVSADPLHVQEVNAPSSIILGTLEAIGFDFELKGDVVRIWGYHPKSYEDFPPDTSATAHKYFGRV